MKPVYLVALALTLAASGWVWLQDHGKLSTTSDVVEVSAPRQRKAEHQPDTSALVTSASSATATTSLLRASIDPAAGDPFNAVVPPPPPPPPAPPLSYTHLTLPTKA
uniref:Proline-rich signal peptide n=1 Tax=Ralstonia solanacearum TaxID=305 RepID=A0A0S4W8Y3_RALSL